MRSLSTFALLLGCALSVVADDKVGPTRDAFAAVQDPFGETVTNVAYVGQNWSPAQSVQFYFTEQGSQILPYDWFLAAEQPDAAKRFRDNQNILKYRYLPQNRGSMNPDGLPVGFVVHKGLGRSWLGITCAACHTAEIHLGTTAYRIDGTPTQGDIQGLITSLTGGSPADTERPREIREVRHKSPRCEKHSGESSRAASPACHRDQYSNELQLAELPGL